MNARSSSFLALAAGMLALACSPNASPLPGEPRSDDVVDADVREPADADAGSDANSDAAAPTPGNPDPEGSSKGADGLACARSETLGGSGREVCVATVGAVELKIVLPLDAATNPAPLRLAMYVHGDGAGAHKSNSAAKTLLPWLDAHHALFVSALAPNGCSWWIEPGYTTCSVNDADQPLHRDVDEQNAPLFEAAIRAIRGAFDVRNDAVLYYGSSGGSMFLAGSFLGRYGHHYPGAFALNCGGEAPWSGFAWDVGSAVERGATKLFFTYGAEDEALLPDLAKVPSTLAALGFPVDDHFVPNQTQHCSFEGGQGAHQRTEQVWSAFLAE